MPVGVKGFQKNDPNINRNGAPKKQFRRDDFTDEFFVNNKDRIYAIGMSILHDAEDGKESAKKMVWDKFWTVPKNRDDLVLDAHTEIVGTLAQFPPEILVQIRTILLEQMKAQGEG